MTPSIHVRRWGDCSIASLSSCLVEVTFLPSCVTVGGSQPHQACVFPFRYLGVTYTSCTTIGLDQPWCSTNTTISGTHIPGHHGLCPPSCPLVEGSSPVTIVNTSTQPTTTVPLTPSIQPTSDCITQSGPAVGSQCVFPFTYSGRTYNNCTQWIYVGENMGKLWCCTK